MCYSWKAVFSLKVTLRMNLQVTLSKVRFVKGKKTTSAPLQEFINSSHEASQEKVILSHLPLPAAGQTASIPHGGHGTSRQRPSHAEDTARADSVHPTQRTQSGYLDG